MTTPLSDGAAGAPSSVHDESSIGEEIEGEQENVGRIFEFYWEASDKNSEAQGGEKEGRGALQGIDASHPQPSADTESESCEGIYAIVPLASPGRLLVMGGDEKVHILQLSTESILNDDGFVQGVVKELPHSLKKVHSDSIATAAISDDQTCVAIGGLDGRVSVYDIKAEQPWLELKNVFEDASADIESVTFAPKSKAILATTQDGQAFCYHAYHGYVSFSANHKGPISCARFVTMKHKPAYITAGFDGYLSVVDPQTGVCHRRIQITKGAAGGGDDDDEDLAMADDEGGVDGDTTDGGGGGVISLDVKDDTTPVALCGCANGSVVLVNYETGVVVKRWPRLHGVVEAVKFAPRKSSLVFNDDYIAAADSNGHIAFTVLRCDDWLSKTQFHSQQDGGDEGEGGGVGVTHLEWTNPDLKSGSGGGVAKSFAHVVAAGGDGIIKVVDCRGGKVLDTLSCGDHEANICEMKLIKWPSQDEDDDLTIVACGTEQGGVFFWQLD